MKTSEFIEKVEKLEFVSEVKREFQFIFIKTAKGTIAAISEVETLDMQVSKLGDFGDIGSKQLFNLLTEYAATPISKRRDKTIEEKAKEYIQSYIADHLSFESARDFLECCSLYVTDNRDFQGRNMYADKVLAEYSAIYDWYHENSTEFIRMWLEVSEYE